MSQSCRARTVLSGGRSVDEASNAGIGRGNSAARSLPSSPKLLPLSTATEGDGGDSDDPPADADWAERSSSLETHRPPLLPPLPLPVSLPSSLPLLSQSLLALQPRSPTEIAPKATAAADAASGKRAGDAEPSAAAAAATIGLVIAAETSEAISKLRLPSTVPGA
jgi:hypothetical protein